MGNCRNVLESIVLQEVQAQLKKLSPDLQKKYNVADLVAYALNRLPPMYVTTQKGWVQSRSRALKEINHQVVDVVKKALHSCRPDPLKKREPLPESELASEPRTLVLLQEFLGNPNLRWDQLPQAVERALNNVTVGGNARSSTPNRRTLDLQTYLGKKKAQPQPEVKEEHDTEEARIKGTVDANDFALYLQVGKMEYRNILESIVTSVARLQISHLAPEQADKVNLDEVTAYTLNRLPPMYATDAETLKEMRLKAKNELSQQIANNVRQGIQLVLQSPKPVKVKPQFLRFNRDMEKAIQEINRMLNRSDVTWRNILDILKQEIETRREALRNQNF
ncbi:MAG: late competence development ComFB family protein [Pseudanabaenaceae cyanobacterium SKYGB_i_bin29]|nr:late competence development ComFB family protein [Pseudanabaenaceae cyanobacterium SKYG29]MDW8420250.1 late competence development ComFB family protein [Pseudanabaenaceae cyanobacterium SKYGB_i_bin29]